MALFNDLVETELEGHSITIEARSTIIAFQYSLIIDGKKQDQIFGSLGTFYLHGLLKMGEEEKTMRVRIQQSFFGTKFFVEYNNQEYIPKKVY